MQKKKGISLIVLIITIIIMIILAGIIIIGLNNSDIIKRANEAVRATNLQEIQQIATLEWSEAYLDGKGKARQSKLYNAVIDGLKEAKVDISECDISVTAKGVSVNKIPTIADLEAAHKFEYYSTLKDAVDAVNGDETVVNVKKEDAVAGIYVEDGVTTVVLLKDTTENEKIIVEKDMTINLGGKQLTINAVVGIDGKSGNKNTITIDGRQKGSTIVVNGTEKGGRVIQTRSNTFIVNGGKYCLLSQNESEDLVSIVFFVSSNGSLIANNCEIVAYTNEEAVYTEAKLQGVQNASGANVTLTNCKIYVYSPSNNCDVYGISNFGNATIIGCEIFTDSKTSSVNHAPKSLSIGITNVGTMIVEDTYVYGNHSGVQTNAGSKTYVTGGTYESPGHGGFYFSQGASGEAYIEDAKINRCAYKGKYEDFSNNSNGGLYIGAGNDAGNHLIVNFNNCEITNPNGPAIVLSSSYGGTDNTVRISNSKISTKYNVRIDSDTHKVFIGRGCNFTKDNTNRPSVVVVTDEVYTK